MEAVSNFEKPARAYFFIWVNENSLVNGKHLLFEINTILSHLPGTLKVF